MTVAFIVQMGQSVDMPLGPHACRARLRPSRAPVTDSGDRICPESAEGATCGDAGTPGETQTSANLVTARLSPGRKTSPR